LKYAPSDRPQQEILGVHFPPLDAGPRLEISFFPIFVISEAPSQPGKCGPVHNRLPSSVAESESRRIQAMAEPAKRIPQWLTIDVLVIVVSLLIIGVGVWIAP
jgi:hypothetical protein